MWGMGNNKAEKDTQIIRGKVFESTTRAPLPDVLVELQNYYPRKTTKTDAEGRFELIDVPLGRHKLLLTKDGYDNLIIPGFEVRAGQSSILSLPMQKKRQAKEESDTKNKQNSSPQYPKKLTAPANKNHSANEIHVSASQVLDIDEIERFAGDQLDPVRLAGSYAGIFSQNDWYNGAVIRGNSPFFMQWRLEDLPINNTSQLGRVGATGGEYNALNLSVLANSSILLTSSTADYGNSIAGVFDARLRKGSVQKTEVSLGYNTLQGILGVVEGPFNPKKKQSSILIAVRAKPRGAFSALATRIGQQNVIAISNASRTYDATLKMSFPKIGLDIFAVGGHGSVNRNGLNPNLAGKDQFVTPNRADSVRTTSMLVGVKHQVYTGVDKSLYWRTVLGVSAFERAARSSSITAGNRILSLLNRQTSILATSYVNKVFAKAFSIRVGLNYRYDFYKFDETHYLQTRQSHYYSGGGQLAQFFAQARCNPNRAWSITGGLTAYYFTFNTTYDFDYRLNVHYKPAKRHHFYLSAGAYSQLLPMQLYTFNHPDIRRNYNDLLAVKSFNLSSGYMYAFAENGYLRLSAYAQFYRNVPTDSLNPAISLINYGGLEDWQAGLNMTNGGLAQNLGAEFSLGKSFSKSYYINLALSYMNIKYWSKHDPSLKFRSAFDNSWIAHILAGKEFEIGRKRKNRFSIDTKIAFVGTYRTRPILERLSASSLYETVYDNVAGYSVLLPFNLRGDLKFSLLLHTNKKRVRLSHRLSVEIINIANYRNYYGHYYNHSMGEVSYYYNYPFLPNIGYRLKF